MATHSFVLSSMTSLSQCTCKPMHLKYCSVTFSVSYPESTGIVLFVIVVIAKLSYVKANCL